MADHYETASFHEASLLMCLGARLVRVDRRARGVAVLDVSRVTQEDVDGITARIADAFADVTTDGKLDPARLSVAVLNSPLRELGPNYSAIRDRVLQ